MASLRQSQAVFSEKRQIKREARRPGLPLSSATRCASKRMQSCKILPRVSLTPLRSTSAYERKQLVPYGCSPFAANNSGTLEKSCRCSRAIIHSRTGKRNYSHSGHPIPVVHTIPFLDASIRGAPLDTLRQVIAQVAEVRQLCGLHPKLCTVR